MYLCVCSVWVLCYSVCVLNIVIPLSSFNALLCFVCLMFAFWCMFKREGVNVSCWYETCFFFSRLLVPFLECYARDHNSGPREQSETGNSVKNTGSVGCFGVTFIWPARLPFVSPGGMKTYRKKRFTSARFAFWRDFLFPLQTFCLQFRVVVVFFCLLVAFFCIFYYFLSICLT